MPAILDLIYREYCRARLAEMRKQLLLSANNDEIPAANWDAGDPAGPDAWGRGLDDDTATKERTHPVAGSCDGGSVGEPARCPHTSRASRPN
jgi:hypothetical protein